MTDTSTLEWVEFRKQVDDGKVLLSSSTVQNMVTYMSHKLTRVVFGEPSQVSTSVLLDNESTYDPSDQCLLNSHVDSESTQRLNDSLSPNSYAGEGSNSTQPLVLKVKKRVGRASRSRRRANYFPRSDAPVTQDEIEARTQRSKDANYRKARRAAEDEAMASSCYTWATLTFDDLHRSDKPQDAYQGFLRRLRQRYRTKTGKPLKHVAVIGNDPDGREHVHALFSEDVDHQDIREAWREGVISELVSIEHDEVETKIRYMARHIRDERVTFGRFIHSRSSDDSDEIILIDNVADARIRLEELIHPHQARVVESGQFDGFIRFTYRFPPIRPEDGSE